MLYQFTQRLKCSVTAIHYDFVAKVGCIDMEHGNVSDMHGAIVCFHEIDPDVRRILTRTPDGSDTCYDKMTNYPPTWRAVDSEGHAWPAVAFDPLLDFPIEYTFD